MTQSLEALIRRCLRALDPDDLALLVRGISQRGEADPQIRCWEGVVLRALERQEDAEVAFRDALRGGYLPAAGELGELLTDRYGLVVEARALLDRAIKLGNNSAVITIVARLLDEDRNEEARQLLEGLAERTPALDVLLGVCLVELGQSVEAMEVFRAAGERGDPEGFSRLADLLTEHERFVEAEVMYERAIAGGHTAARMYLGAFLRRAGRQQEAEALYAGALEHGDTAVALNYGALLESLDRDEEAVLMYRLAAGLGDELAHRNLGNLLAWRGDREQAKAHLEHALRCEGDLEALGSLVELLRADGEDVEAESLLDEFA